jgi:16S rRNA (cytidine1402-2'-O)-methyltransferase
LIYGSNNNDVTSCVIVVFQTEKIPSRKDIPMATLHLISLPLGNLGDLTDRVRQVLLRERKFLAEDTRVFKSLLKNLDIDISEYSIQSFHDHGQEAAKGWGKLLDEGHDLYIVSDAGSPLVSDPAFPLIREALKRGHALESLPGATAPIVALELSGLPPHPFMFGGFLPREKKKRQSLFEESLGGVTMIFFEGISRIKDSVTLLAETLPEAEIVIARELTKTHQQILRFRGLEWKDIQEDLVEKGEVVLLFHHQKIKQQASSKELTKLAERYLEKPSTKTLAKILAQASGQEIDQIYTQITQKV